MTITVLVENTISSLNQNPLLSCEHGLSLFIETENKKILFDMGQSDLFLKNANALNIDINSIDFAVISHGHYDHGGIKNMYASEKTGGLGIFFDANKTAPVYINQNAFDQNYNAKNKFIGLDKSLLENQNRNRFIFVHDELKIDQNISLFSCNSFKKVVAHNPYGLSQFKNNQFIPDEFFHEHYLLIKENNKKILFSGCSHKGILNITEWFKPDYLIGGFHLKSLEATSTQDSLVLKNIANKLLSYKTKFFTCHCTGEEQFSFLKKTMGQKLEYIATGDSIKI